MKTPLAFDDYTEVFSECEMDQDLKKALKDMAGAIEALARHTTEAPGPAAPADKSVDEKIGTLHERSLWTQKIGWGIAGLYGLAFVGIATFWIPREVSNAEVKLSSDTATQLLPIQTQLARLNGLMELKQSKDVGEAIAQSADFSTPKPAIEAIKAIVQQAKRDRLPTPPEVLQNANAQIQGAVSSHPQLKEPAWSARLELVDYRSALEQPFKGTRVPDANQQPAFSVPQLPVVQGSILKDAAQKLDGAFWKNMVFQNMHIVYDGGPMALQNVRFINCTFEMGYNARTSKLADLVLGESSISASLS